MHLFAIMKYLKIGFLRLSGSGIFALEKQNPAL